jgi:hypothetical protein
MSLNVTVPIRTSLNVTVPTETTIRTYNTYEYRHRSRIKTIYSATMLTIYIDRLFMCDFIFDYVLQIPRTL